jgi:hypothetical protein
LFDIIYNKKPDTLKQLAKCHDESGKTPLMLLFSLVNCTSKIIPTVLIDDDEDSNSQSILSAEQADESHNEGKEETNDVNVTNEDDDDEMVDDSNNENDHDENMSNGSDESSDDSSDDQGNAFGKMPVMKGNNDSKKKVITTGSDMDLFIKFLNVIILYIHTNNIALSRFYQR